jgi:hypothetical protein
MVVITAMMCSFIPVLAKELHPGGIFRCDKLVKSFNTAASICSTVCLSGRAEFRAVDGEIFEIVLRMECEYGKVENVVVSYQQERSDKEKIGDNLYEYIVKFSIIRRALKLNLKVFSAKSGMVKRRTILREEWGLKERISQANNKTSNLN